MRVPDSLSSAHGRNTPSPQASRPHPHADSVANGASAPSLRQAADVFQRGVAQLAQALRIGVENREQFQERLQERIGRLTRLIGGPDEAGAAGTTSSTAPVPPPTSAEVTPSAQERAALRRFREAQRAFDDDSTGSSVDVRR